jgi:ferredoxin-NADP reductase
MSLRLRIHDVVPATPRSHIVRLALEDELFRYRPGQAAYLQPDSSPKRRAFSIASAPAETAHHGLIEFLVQTAEGGLALDCLYPGNIVTVDGPLGSFTFPETNGERRFVFIAGGTGIAPLRSMLWQAVLSDRPGQLSLVYSVRTPSDLAYLQQFERLESEGRIAFRRTVTRCTEDGWTGGLGRIVADDLKDLINPGETVCFVCGPPAFTNDIPSHLKTLGVGADQIRIEKWG